MGKGEETSIWKKEIRLGRKPKPEPAPAPAAEQTSVWKKEIRLGRKPEPEPEPAPAAEQTSVWKKEIRLGRKPKADPLLEPPAPAEPEPVAAASDPELWVFAPPAAIPERNPVELEPAQMPWAFAPPVPEPEPELPPAALKPVEPEPVAADPEPWAFAPPAPEPEPELPPAALKPVEPEPVAADPEPWAFAPPAPEPEPEPPPAVLEPPEPVHAEQAVPAEPERELPPAALKPVEPVHAEQAVPAEPERELPPAALKPAEPELAQMPWAFAPPVPEPEPELLPAAPAPPAPEPVSAPAAEQTSVWKKEIRLGRKPKPVPPSAAAATSVWKKDVSFRRKPKPKPEPAAEQTSVWKKEIRLGRKPKPKPKPEPAAEQTSVWKKEIRLGRKPKPKPKPEPAVDSRAAALAEIRRIADETRAAIYPEGYVPPAEPEPAAWPAPEAAEPAAERTSIWKKEIGLGKKPKTPGVRPPTPRSETPLWKKEISLRAKSKPAARRRKGSGKREKRVVGLKIGASQVAAARVVNNGSAHVVQLARAPLQHGIVVGGELRDPEALAGELKRFFRKHRLPRRGVRLGLANNRIGVRTVEISGIDDQRQLENAIRFRAQEALPIPLDEAVLDYRILAESTDAEGVTTRRILIVVAHQDLIGRYVAACRKAGIRLIGIDLEAFGLLRALAPGERTADDAALVVVSIGHDRSNLAVSDGEFCEFSRVLDWGGGALDVVLARALDLVPSQAEQIKLKLSLLDDAEPPAGLSPAAFAAAQEAVRNQLQAFSRELVASLRFYQSQPDSLGIGDIVLTGGTAHLPGLAEELGRLVGVEVHVGDPLANVRAGRRVRKHEAVVGSLASAIGLGIEL